MAVRPINVNGHYLGCVMYADDLLLSASVAQWLDCSIYWTFVIGLHLVWIT